MWPFPHNFSTLPGPGPESEPRPGPKAGAGAGALAVLLPLGTVKNIKNCQPIRKKLLKI